MYIHGKVPLPGHTAQPAVYAAFDPYPLREAAGTGVARSLPILLRRVIRKGKTRRIQITATCVPGDYPG